MRSGMIFLNLSVHRGLRAAMNTFLREGDSHLISIGRVVCSPLRVTREPAGTLPRITQPAPMTQLSPMSVPLSSTTSEAIQQLRPTVMQPAVHSRLTPSSRLKRWLLSKIFTPGPKRVFSPMSIFPRQLMTAPSLK